MVAYIFPGQGSQYIGMGGDLYESYPAARQIFDQADKTLGFKISQICFSGQEEMLKSTTVQQPAVLTVSIAALEAFKSEVRKQKSEVSYVAGLSLGEYSALVASGALPFEQALRLVRKRAELMEEAAKQNPGKMTAIIGLDREDIKNICKEVGEVGIANFNCPGQSVITGKIDAVDKAKGLTLQRGAKRVIDLKVNGAFHSFLMKEAANVFKKALEGAEFNNSDIPLVSNVDAQAHRDKSEIKENLERQIYSSVLWEDSMRFIISKGTSTFYEVGPGKVLKGLMRQIEKNVEVINIEKKEDIANFGG